MRLPGAPSCPESASELSLNSISHGSERPLDSNSRGGQSVKLRALGLFAIVALAVWASQFDSAQAGGGERQTKVTYACVNVHNGQVRYVQDADDCKKGEFPIKLPAGSG